MITYKYDEKTSGVFVTLRQGDKSWSILVRDGTPNGNLMQDSKQDDHALFNEMFGSFEPE